MAGGHLLLPAKGALVSECVRRSRGKSHNMPTGTLCMIDGTGSRCSGVSQVQ